MRKNVSNDTEHLVVGALRFHLHTVKFQDFRSVVIKKLHCHSLIL